MVFILFFFKQKTAYELRISDWSSDVCSSDLAGSGLANGAAGVSARRNLADEAVDRRLQVVGALGQMLGRCRYAVGGVAGLGDAGADQIGRASCRERVCQYV